MLQDMMLDVERLMADPARAAFIKKETLCCTLAGNPVPILTITSNDPVFDIRNKKFVIITSRVHPGKISLLLFIIQLNFTLHHF